VKLVNVDLNLLLSLDALLQERSVTKAAERLGLSQPALSAALARLRRHFDDDLLLRIGNSYELTPLAVQLRERTSVAVTDVERVFGPSTLFEPRTSRREFTLLASDYSMAVIGEKISLLLAERAPAMRLRLVHHDSGMIEGSGDAMRAVDGLLLPHGLLTDVPHLDLFEDEWVCLVAADNDRVGDELTMDNLATLPWVLTYHGPRSFTPAGRQLQALGVEPHVELVVESFLALPFLIAGSDRIGLVQRQLVPRLTASGDVRALRAPFEAVPLVEAFWWHPIHAGDPEHEWLRSTLADAGRLVMAAVPG
jgi:DNA-binding transcriptional LysR family regulator